MYALVDTNILLDILTANPVWCQPALDLLDKYTEYTLSINPIIFGELSAGFEKIETLNQCMLSFNRLPLPYEGAFLAEKAFLHYKKLGGTKQRPLPDFFIGAHASVLNIPLFTRDKHRYLHYFPKLKIITS